MNDKEAWMFCCHFFTWLKYEILKLRTISAFLGLIKCVITMRVYINSVLFRYSPVCDSY